MALVQAQSVTWFADNQDVVRIVNCGSRVPALQDLAINIFQTCLLNGVSIDMQWIPRDLNSVADDISKFIDHDDYSINDTVCNALEDLWDPHTCDRFACPYNAKVQCFNTKILSTRLKWCERFLPRLVSPQQFIGFVSRFI